MSEYQTSANIDAALSILCDNAEYGQTLSYYEIADVCECAQSTISAIARRALRKIKDMPHLHQYAEDMIQI